MNKDKLNIINKDIGISSEDVANCYDKNILLNWKEELCIHLTNVKNQIDVFDMRQSEGLPATRGYDWYVNVKKYVKVQGHLINQINNQLSLVKDLNKSRTERIEINFWRNKCEEMTSENEFKTLINDLQDLINQS